MQALASMDWLAAQTGLSHLGGACALYDLPLDEQVETLAVAMVRTRSPGMADGLTFGGAAQLIAATRPKPPAKRTMESLIPAEARGL